jgi:mannose-6-phosphate isomerase-like protein (cupin superfamily)
MPFKIIKPATAPRRSLEPGRGESIRLIDTGIGVESLDVHMNILRPNGPRGRVHRHTKSDNVYIVKSGEGLMTIEGENHAIVTDDVVHPGRRQAFPEQHVGARIGDLRDLCTGRRGV